MSFSSDRFWALENQVCHYAWGARGDAAQPPYIAALLSQPPGALPWAELWLGAHAKLPSILQLNAEKIPLHKLIEEFPEQLLGRHCLQAGFRELPFLLKILSCDSALSIQCHPDAANARRLHAEKPELYPDDKHKPEILLALTEFEALAGFREYRQVKQQLRQSRLFDNWLGFQLEKDFSDDMPGLCHALFALPESDCLHMLQNASQELNRRQALSDEEKLFLRLLEAYPDDKGSCFAFLLQHHSLNPGQALYLPPGMVHAYLQGSGIECMAASDNVIRAGLTQKYVAAEEMRKNADFSSRSPMLLSGNESSKGRRCYACPAREFRLLDLQGQNLRLDELAELPGLLLLLEGEGELINPDGSRLAASKGSAWLRPAKLRQGEFRALADNTRAVYCEGIVIHP